MSDMLAAIKGHHLFDDAYKELLRITNFTDNCADMNYTLKPGEEAPEGYTKWKWNEDETEKIYNVLENLGIDAAISLKVDSLIVNSRYDLFFIGYFKGAKALKNRIIKFTIIENK